MDAVLERLARAEAVEQLLRVQVALVGLDAAAQRAVAAVALAYLDHVGDATEMVAPQEPAQTGGLAPQESVKPGGLAPQAPETAGTPTTEAQCSRCGSALVGHCADEDLGGEVTMCLVCPECDLWDDAGDNRDAGEAAAPPAKRKRGRQPGTVARVGANGLKYGASGYALGGQKTTCARCGAAFVTRGNTNGRYCSSECSGTGPKTRECLTCGKEFAIRQGAEKWCSEECRKAYKKKPRAAEMAERKEVFLRAVNELAGADVDVHSLASAQLCPDCGRRGLDVRRGHGEYVVTCPGCPQPMKYRYDPASWEGYDSQSAMTSVHSVGAR